MGTRARRSKPPFTRRALWLGALALAYVLAACSSAPSSPTPVAASGSAVSALKVIAVESFLADIAQNVAGDRLHIETLMPIGADPHTFEPTPQDVRKLDDAQVIILNGAGFEVFLNRLLENVGSPKTIVEASAGLPSRTLRPDEPHDADNPRDPHYWLDPTKTIRYVENIRAALVQADPAGAATYRANADAYIAKLNALDREIQTLVDEIPPANRKLVTDHDTFGYFANRYGFELVGMLVPSMTTADAASAQQLAELVNRIRASGAQAIFLEQSANPAVADTVASDTGVRVVTGLYTHSLSEPNGPAPTYLKMLEYDARTIADALK